MAEVDNTLLIRRLIGEELARTESTERMLKRGGGNGGNGTEARIAKIEAIIPTLATKSDVADVRTDIHKAESSHVKWSIGVGITVAGLIIGYLNLSKSAPPSPQAQPQPIVIQLPPALAAPALSAAPAPAPAPQRP